ncbi:MAG: hypothetical protein EP330_01480 [Deltaproteobacteria bacterium]|nr:MAG: hypothetical protein EP330_01480 [Deltaproteobacteria bacterium]
MGRSSVIEVLHRNRFRPVDDARIERISSNAWTVRIPVSSPIHKAVRRNPTAEGWDGAVFLIEDTETEPALGSAVRGGFVEISAFSL